MPAITPNVWNGQRAVFVGDSITNPIPPGGGGDATNEYNAWWTPLVGHTKPSLALPNAFVNTTPALQAVSPTSGRSSPSAAGVMLGSHRTGVNLDVQYRTYPGQTVGVIGQSVNEHIGLLRPDAILFLHMGINDVNTSVALGSSTTNYDNYFIAVRARYPSIPIVVLGLFAIGERWAAAPNRLLDGEPAIGDFCTMLQTLCATYSATYVDLRAALLAYEMTAQPVPGSSVDRGFATWDLIHPTTAGKIVISNATYAVLTVT